MPAADLQDDELLALDIEATLRRLRIASTGGDEAGLRLAVDTLRHAGRLLPSPSTDASMEGPRDEAGGPLVPLRR